MKKYEPIMKGYKIGLAALPTNNKAPTLTTEYAHRTNSYGLLHVMIYEECNRSSK